MTARKPKASLKLDVNVVDGEATVTVVNAPSGTLYIAAARDHAVTEVKKGENAGRTLNHVAVVYRIASGKAGPLKLKIEPGSRLVAWVTDKPGGAVLAVAVLNLT